MIHGMRVTVSIPDQLIARITRLARRTGRSRREVITSALSEYVARHDADEVTRSMNRICGRGGSEPDAFVSAAGRRVLDATEW
jgi:metal-responsive CopG/Arc/MetJ family transcriptional regulator